MHRRGATTARRFEPACSQPAARRNDAGNRTPAAEHEAGWVLSIHPLAVASPPPDSQPQAASQTRIATAGTEGLRLHLLADEETLPVASSRRRPDQSSRNPGSQSLDYPY